jgi:hypothetical protein
MTEHQHAKIHWIFLRLQTKMVRQHHTEPDSHPRRLQLSTEPPPQDPTVTSSQVKIHTALHGTKSHLPTNAEASDCRSCRGYGKVVAQLIPSSNLQSRASRCPDHCLQADLRMAQRTVECFILEKGDLHEALSSSGQMIDGPPSWSIQYHQAYPIVEREMRIPSSKEHNTTHRT